MAANKLINCLAYALRYWDQHSNYRIYYDGCHMVNSKYELHDPRYPIPGWYEPMENAGYEYYRDVFGYMLDEYEHMLLKKYFNIN